MVRDPVRFREFCESARIFWRNNVAPPPPPDAEGRQRIIVVEALSQDLRVNVRTLTVANALRRLEPARLVVLTGIDDDWSTIWSFFDLETNLALAEAYGADQVVDIHSLVASRVRGDAEPLVVGGVDIGGPLPSSGIPPERMDQIVDATACRMARVARMDDSPEHRTVVERIAATSREFADVFDALVQQGEVVALVTSHIDYNNFGLPVEAALRGGVPVLFPQSTGGLKSYALFPENHDHDGPIRAGLTRQIGEFFEQHIWSNHELLGQASDLVLHRLKDGLGRPAWWRADGAHSQIQLRDALERSAIRTPAAEVVGLDPAKPVVAVFNHAVSDALGTNVEAFADLGEWFERTIEFAVQHDEVQWLFVDHPVQLLYDESRFFERLAEKYGGHPHLAFFPSLDLSKTYLVSLTDLAVTVRGSVSNEYPAFGIPALQAGWSEWSQCGFTRVAETPEDYFAQLEKLTAGLLAGEVLITPEQVERARLWAWFYRSASDLTSMMVGHWELGEEDDLLRYLDVSMSHVESDAEQAFAAVRRLWRRREPFLTRTDWLVDHDQLVENLAGVTR